MLLKQKLNYLYLIDLQARMSLRVDASRMLLGYLWWIIEPLLYVAVFYLVFNVIFDSGRADFLLFLICGKLPFMWLSGSINSASATIIVARGLIAKIWLPKVIFPLAKVQEILYKQVVVFALLLVYVSLEGRAPSFNWLWLLPLVIVEYLIIVACAIAGALLVCLAQDFQRLIQLGTLFLLFASGIFWDVRSIPSPEIQSNVLTFNPVAFLLDGYRQVLMWGGAPDVMHLLLLGLVAALACAGLIWWSSRLEQWLALRVLSL